MLNIKFDKNRLKIEQVKNLILYFLLIVVVLFNLVLNAIYKRGRFFKALSKKNFKLILNKRYSPVSFFLDFMLLLSRINLIMEE